jgi:GxxExxY protein
VTREEYQAIYDVVGVAMEVHATLGRGLAEPVYQEAFAIEMRLRDMEVQREKVLQMHYKGVLMEKTYIADFYYRGVIIEFKAVDKIISDHRAQLLNYMRIARQKRGVLFNFGERNLHTERYLFLPESDKFVLLTKDNYMQYIDD